MSRLPKGVIVNQELVSIEFEGRMVSGTYTVRRGGITVTSDAGVKNAVVGRLEPNVLARMMLEELEQDRKRRAESQNQDSSS
jgi:hypothetical protein